MKKSTRLWPLLPSILIACNSVIAQTHRDQLETVVVTTEKLGRSIRDTTTSIEILTGDALEERSIEDIYEVVR
jgi:hypothetical protein